jgi:hypothetical protein
MAARWTLVVVSVGLIVATVLPLLMKVPGR